MEFDLKQIGLTNKKLQQQLVSHLGDRLLGESSVDGGYISESDLSRDVRELIKTQIDETVRDLADEHILPNVTRLVEGAVLGKTNEWGEKKGKDFTFKEYLVDRADKYLAEKVDFQGKDEQETGKYNFKGKQTRITYLINKHLHNSIETAMRQAIQNANDVLVGGLEETVKQKLQEISARLKVAVKTN